MSLALLMDEMAAKIEALFDASDNVQVTSRMNFNPTPPSIDIYPGDPSREEQTAAFDDISGSLLFNVRARVGTADHEAGQEVLLALMDDEDDWCIAAALLDDPTLNGYATAVDLSSMSGYMLFPTPDGGAFLGCLWQFEVIPARS